MCGNYFSVVSVVYIERGNKLMSLLLSNNCYHMMNEMAISFTLAAFE